MFQFLIALGTVLFAAGLWKRTQHGSVGQRDVKSFVRTHENGEVANEEGENSREWEAPIRSTSPEERPLMESIESLQERLHRLERHLFEGILDDAKSSIAKEKKSFSQDPSSMEASVLVPDALSVHKELEDLPVDPPMETNQSKSRERVMPEKVRRFMELEREGLTLHQIARRMRMKKGEVLLLINLAKHYQGSEEKF